MRSYQDILNLNKHIYLNVNSSNDNNYQRFALKYDYNTAPEIFPKNTEPEPTSTMNNIYLPDLRWMGTGNIYNWPGLL